MRKVTSPTARAIVIGLATLLSLTIQAAPASAATPQAPGNFTGYGFDACSAPSQKTMDVWNLKSPFSAIGIYISGNSRYCGDTYQPNLTKAWVQQNAANGWRFMPIHVGYQSPCFKNNSKSRVQKRLMSTTVSTARKQATSDAAESLAAAKRLGFGTGSVLYLDMEYYARTKACDNVVLEFEDAWTEKLHAAGFKSGLYSSGSAAIKATDDAVAAKRANFNAPDQLWIAWTNKVANTYGGPYVGASRWANHQRIHQYWNGVDVTYGGVKINIDKNFLDVGKGSVRTADPKPCGVAMSFTKYPSLKLGSSGPTVAALQCLLKQLGLKKTITSVFGSGTRSGVAAYQKRRGWTATGAVDKKTWISLLTTGSKPRVMKAGSVGAPVWALQRSLVAAGKTVKINGLFDTATSNAVVAYRKTNKLTGYATAESTVWAKLFTGKSG